jgi:type VI secretion system protein ImpB
MADNVQHKIARNRPPRVQITYDVEIGNAIEKAEIPFVVGIMANLSGFDKENPDFKLKDKARPFVEIDRDNFADVMAKIAPALTVGREKVVFKSLDDFNPKALVESVAPLKDLQRKRIVLRDILTKIDSNDALHDELKRKVKDGRVAALGEEAARLLPGGSQSSGHSSDPPGPGPGPGPEPAPEPGPEPGPGGGGGA